MYAAAGQLARRCRRPAGAAAVKASAGAGLPPHLCISREPLRSRRQPSKTLSIPWSSAPRLCTICAFTWIPLPSTSRLWAATRAGAQGRRGSTRAAEVAGGASASAWRGSAVALQFPSCRPARQSDPPPCTRARLTHAHAPVAVAAQPDAQRALGRAVARLAHIQGHIGDGDAIALEGSGQRCCQG